MNYVEFFKKLMRSETSGVYLVDSEEEYLSTTLIEEAERSINIKDFNLIRLKGNLDYDEFKTTFETYPVMEDKKIIIWQNIDLSRDNIKNYKHILDNLEKDMEDFPNFASLIIFPEGKIFKGKFYKKVKSLGNIVYIDRLDRNELGNFIRKRFKSHGKKISDSHILRIMERFSYLNSNSEVDLFEIVNSIDKIISNSNQEVIKLSDIDDQLDQILNLNIFNLTDALSEKNTKKAMKVFLNMIDQGEDPFMVFHMIIRQVRILISVKYLRSKGFNDSFIRKSAKIGSYELKKAKGFEKNFTLDKLIKIQDDLFDMEVRQKSEDFDMKLEILKLISSFKTK